jgi:hypothetical protein
VPEYRDGKQVRRSGSRLSAYKKDGVLPQLPDPGPAGHLLEYLWEVGPTLAAGDGEAVITQGEIRAWQDNMGVDLAPWEVSLMRRLSQEFLAQLRASTDPNCKPPFGQLYKAPNIDKKIDAALD